MKYNTYNFDMLIKGKKVNLTFESTSYSDATNQANAHASVIGAELV